MSVFQPQGSAAGKPQRWELTWKKLEAGGFGVGSKVGEREMGSEVAARNPQEGSKLEEVGLNLHFRKKSPGLLWVWGVGGSRVSRTRLAGQDAVCTLDQAVG